MAILLVVAGHSYGSWEQDLLVEQTIANLITGATALFVFISGFFFDAIFIKNFSYRAFMAKKARNILIPYLVLTFAYLSAYITLHGAPPFPISLSDDPQTQNILAIALDIVSGRTLIAYWYIPFIMLVFLASPAFVGYARLTPTKAIVILGASFVVAMIVHRSPYSLNPIHSFLYFTPYYLFGMFYSRFRHAIDAWLEGKAALLFTGATVVAITMSYLGQLGNISKWSPFYWNGLDWMVPQKILLILAFLSLFRRLQEHRSETANYIAQASFAIFFLHPWILVALDFTGLDAQMAGFLGFIFRSIILVSFSLLIAETVKSIAGKYSRFLVGY